MNKLTEFGTKIKDFSTKTVEDIQNAITPTTTPAP